MLKTFYNEKFTEFYSLFKFWRMSFWHFSIYVFLNCWRGLNSMKILFNIHEENSQRLVWTIRVKLCQIFSRKSQKKNISVSQKHREWNKNKNLKYFLVWRLSHSLDETLTNFKRSSIFEALRICRNLTVKYISITQYSLSLCLYVFMFITFTLRRLSFQIPHHWISWKWQKLHLA